MSVVTALQALLTPIVAPSSLILAEQNGPRPPKPYATLSVRSTALDPPIELPVDENGIAQMVAYMRVIAELQYYGLGAFQSAQIAGLKLRFRSSVALAETLGVSVNNIRTVLRVPELLNETQYEERGLMEFAASAFVTATDDVGLIEHAEIVCFDHTHLISDPPDNP